jgi:hypothetical protein
MDYKSIETVIIDRSSVRKTQNADDEINLLIKAFEERTLPKAEWTYAAHLTVALYYCFHHPFGAAKRLMGEGIYWLNVAHGTPNTETSGYHETLTVFWLKVVAAFLETHGRGKGLTALANELTLFYSDSELSLKFYSREILFSSEAREKYVLPDLRRFPAEKKPSFQNDQNKMNFIQSFFFERDCPCGWLHGV